MTWCERRANTYVTSSKQKKGGGEGGGEAVTRRLSFWLLSKNVTENRTRCARGLEALSRTCRHHALWRLGRFRLIGCYYSLRAETRPSCRRRAERDPRLPRHSPPRPLSFASQQPHPGTACASGQPPRSGSAGRMAHLCPPAGASLRWATGARPPYRPCSSTAP